MYFLSDDMMRFALPGFCVLFFLGTVVIRAWVTMQRTGVNPLVHDQLDSVYGFLKTVALLVTIGTGGLLGLYLFSPTHLTLLAPITWLQTEWVRLAGVLVLVVSFIGAVLAQSSLGGSWRIGIDRASHTELQISGLYHWSRNPIFFFFRLNMLGLFLVVPNAASLALFLINDLLMQAEVRCEEEFLRDLHGMKFEDYCRRVRRWI